MKLMNRIHLYPHSGPGSTGYIVADRQGLRDLAKRLQNAADSIVGLENVTVYASDGHAYELMVVADVTEEEWQSMPLPSDHASDPKKLAIVNTYLSLKATV